MGSYCISIIHTLGDTMLSDLIFFRVELAKYDWIENII